MLTLPYLCVCEKFELTIGEVEFAERTRMLHLQNMANDFKIFD